MQSNRSSEKKDGSKESWRMLKTNSTPGKDDRYSVKKSGKKLHGTGKKSPEGERNRKKEFPQKNSASGETKKLRRRNCGGAGCLTKDQATCMCGNTKI